ncbi:hypothetical protein GCM10022380_65110 [Amycolatopsis tucumanensis]|uniref:Uncharacterized protein n=1 Tax=Amycolatopsis tucumanensis TaxID=401106 RepID=A0ABP7JAB4_9PSEU
MLITHNHGLPIDDAGAAAATADWCDMGPPRTPSAFEVSFTRIAGALPGTRRVSVLTGQGPWEVLPSGPSIGQIGHPVKGVTRTR